jgi:hypothetical protein
VKSRFTYKGPVALYISYYILFALSLCLVALSFKVDSESRLFTRLLATGIGAAVVSLSLILYYTQIERRIVPGKWRKKVNAHYNDEGIFEYTPAGFLVMMRDGNSLSLRWQDIVRAESGENKINQHVKKFHIDLFLSEREFFTVDSAMPGFYLFEKRLKENLREILKKEVVEHTEYPDSLKQAAVKIS